MLEEKELKTKDIVLSDTTPIEIYIHLCRHVNNGKILELVKVLVKHFIRRYDCILLLKPVKNIDDWDNGFRDFEDANNNGCLFDMLYNLYKKHKVNLRVVDVYDDISQRVKEAAKIIVYYYVLKRLNIRPKTAAMLAYIFERLVERGKINRSFLAVSFGCTQSYVGYLFKKFVSIFTNCEYREGVLWIKDYKRS